jgi:EmrB/QacA subfamily drug resistance transporter
MDASTPPDLRTAPHFAHRQIVTIMTGLMLSLFVTTIDQTIFSPALPRIASDLSGGASVSWIISIYLLSSTAVTPVYGKLSDLYGRKLILEVSLGIFILGSILCALATSMTQLIAFRLLQGAGGGALMPLSFAIVGDVIPARERGRYQGYFAVAFGTASIIGPILGGWFADQLSWRFAFWINLPLGLAAMLIAEFALRGLHAKRLRQAIDYAGGCLIVGAASAIMLAMTLGGKELAWSAPALWGIVALGVLMFAAAIMQERRARDPMLPPRLFANPTFRVSNGTTFICAMALIGGTIFIPEFFQVIYGLSAKQSGFAIMPFLLLWTLGGLAVGRYIMTTGRYRWLPLAGLVIATVAMLGLAVSGATTPLWFALAAVSLLGIGTSPVFNVMLLGLQNAVERGDLGTATAANGFVRSLGSAFGVTLFGALLADHGAAMPGSAFQHAFIAGAILMVLGLLIALRLKELPLATRHG